MKNIFPQKIADSSRHPRALLSSVTLERHALRVRENALFTTRFSPLLSPPLPRKPGIPVIPVFLYYLIFSPRFVPFLSLRHRSLGYRVFTFRIILYALTLLASPNEDFILFRFILFR